MPQAELVRLYKQVYLMALAIPFVSVLGVGVAWMLQRRHKAALIQQGFSPAQAKEMVNVRGDGSEATKPNWWILGGSLVFALFTVTVGLGGFPYSEEIVFVGSMAIVLFLMARLVRELEPDKRFTLVGTAVVVFIFRAIPGTGPGATWWMIDQLKFDQQFLSILSLIGSTLTLAGMFVFRRFMAERSIAYVVGFLTVIGTVLTLPVVSMFYGLHEWTARMTGGCGRCAIYCVDRYGVGIAARADLHDSDAGLDCELRAGELESHLLCRDGLVHEPGVVVEPARDQVFERCLRGHARGARPSNRRHSNARRL